MIALTPEEMRKIDRFAIETLKIPPETLMSAAAKAVYRVFMTEKQDKAAHIVLLCGKGNNGGDGYALAEMLARNGYRPVCIHAQDCPPASSQAAHFYDAALESGVPILAFRGQQTIDAIAQADIIVDALFGTGFTGAVKQESAEYSMIDAANHSSAFRISVDVPSGVNACDGTVSGIAFRADRTVTFAYPKAGAYSYPAREYGGRITVADIGIPNTVIEQASLSPKGMLTDDNDLTCMIPTRKQNSNKGDYGALLAFCGREKMTGAPFLAAMGALRTGIGLLTLASDTTTIRILQTRLAEPVFFPLDLSSDEAVDLLLDKATKSDAFLIGCGLGKSWRMAAIIRKLVTDSPCPIILDADGINTLSGNIHVLKEAKKIPILTPHPLEFSRITEHSVAEIQANRLPFALEFAQEYGAVVVLKGASTIIASPDGRYAVNTTGNPGLAKGGSGDVLAGVIASLTAQGLTPFEAAVCGAYVHGKAGDRLAETISLSGYLPSELPLEIGKCLP